MRFEMVATAIIVLGIPAFAEPLIESVQIGKSVTIGASTQTWRVPLDKTITLRMANGTLGSLLEEVSKQTKMKLILIQGLEQCRVSAFVRDLTARQVLQLTLVAGGMTYQGAGGGYIITRRKGGPDCSPIIDVAKGSCHVLEGAPISLECKDGSLSALAEALYDQSDGSYFVWNEAVDHGISIKLKRSKLTKAIKKIKKDTSVDVQQLGSGSGYVFLAALRRTAPEQPEVVRSTAAPVGPNRQEPEANPAYKPGMPN